MAHEYDKSPLTAAQTVTEDELTRLLRSDLAGLGRDTDAVRHLLGRFVATLRTHQRDMRQLRTDIDRIALESKTDKTPLAAAVSALGKLSVDEQRQVLDVHAAALLADLRAATAEARRLKLAATSELNRVKLVLARVLEDPDLSPVVKGRIDAALAALPASGALPAEPGTVDVDTVLDPGRGGFTVAPKVAAAGSGQRPDAAGPGEPSAAPAGGAQLSALFD